MPFFVGEKMTGGYGGPDIITSCTVNVNRGEIVAILGPNGAGKTTTIKILTTLLQPTNGQVNIATFDVKKNPDAGVDISYFRLSFDCRLFFRF